MSYIPHTPEDVKDMLDAVGVKSVDDLFADIPQQIRCPELDLPAGLSELEVRTRLKKLAAANTPAGSGPFFLGAGAYNHYIPAAVDAVLSRSEFFTAYTPYQAEMSQGMLQAIYEYQTMICQLTGLDVSNASLYDGATALAEAVVLSRAATRRNKVVVCTGVNPRYRDVLKTYSTQLEFDLTEVPAKEGKSDLSALGAALDDTVAAVIVQNPNFFGTVQDFTALAETVHANRSLLVMSCYPTSLGAVKTPAEMGADIATGDGQPLGIPLQFGGPYLGFITANAKFVRKMPGRIAGQTLDTGGKRGFVLTLQAREQHIRREKATSNICSNQALCALAASVYLASLGKNGLGAIADLNLRTAAYAKKVLTGVKGVTLKWDVPVFNEFVIETPKAAAEVLAALREKGITGGLALGEYYPDMANAILVTATETVTVEDMDAYAAALTEVLA